MDHGGQFERDSRTMSRVSPDGFDLCDNVAISEALTAQTQNLNETQSLPLSQNDEEEMLGLGRKASLNDNVRDEQEEVKRKEECTERRRDEDEEEDTDEVMKEEEEESEASSSLICCQSPDVLMTDSSYSETGSLLETPYPFSPGTSPEPTSPIVPVVGSDTSQLTSLLERNQSDAGLTGSMICTHGATFSSGTADFPPQTMTPDGPDGEASDRTIEVFSAEQVTSSTEPVSPCGSASSDTGPISSVTFVLNELTRTDASTPASATTKNPFTFTTGPQTTDPESTSIASHLSSNQEQNTSAPVTTSSSFSTCSRGSVLSPALLKSLEQLAQSDDDTHLPQYFHQIAEDCVLQKDFQRAIWFIQLERLYHERVLDNLNTLQEQWESHCEGTSSDLPSQHLDTLKHICRTHTRPRTRHAEGAVLDVLRPKSEAGDLQPSCTSTPQVEGGMEQRAEDSSSSVRPSSNFLEKLNPPEKDREDPSEELEGRGILHESKLMEKQSHGSEVKGGAECTISTMGNGLHPSSAADMDRSSSAEQQGEDLGPAQEREAKREEVERDTEEAKEALAMEDEGADDEEEEVEEVSVETLNSGAELEEEQLQTDGLIQEKLHDESQQCPNTQQSSTPWLYEETLPPEEAHWWQQEQCAQKKEEEEADYEADLIREAPSLDHMARLITIEEISPSSGLVSILKKQSVYGEIVSPVPKPEKPTAKRRVRFRVPDDNYDHDVGSGDSCLLLFLLCLVTVVISIGGTALYCAFGDAQSSVCQDFFRNADFYMDQIHRRISQLQLWFAPGS
ncbi:consortin isoform X2 [Austrofundulus limnaeus]|uniref:Consortin isoform X2 n=1 Tax=Austrofundulus limnaeus TaxID=52670 RepID=A0A2I4BY69_AUSLI|nr:PREDICTED: consortin isoform X2 [Austrofundulus limnaeus]